MSSPNNVLNTVRSAHSDAPQLRCVAPVSTALAKNGKILEVEVNMEVVMDLLSNPPWYYQLFLGAILGISLPGVIKVISLPFRVFQSHPIKGKWWEYHFSEKNREIRVFESQVKIRNGVFGGLVFKAIQDTDLRYSGKIVEEKNSSQFLLIGKRYRSKIEENMIWRFEGKIESNAESIYGINLSYNHNTHPYSSTCVLVDKKLTYSEAEILIKGITRNTADIPILMIKHRP